MALTCFFVIARFTNDDLVLIGRGATYSNAAAPALFSVLQLLLLLLSVLTMMMVMMMLLLLVLSLLLLVRFLLRYVFVPSSSFGDPRRSLLATSLAAEGGVSQMERAESQDHVSSGIRTLSLMQRGACTMNIDPRSLRMAIDH